MNRQHESEVSTVSSGHGTETGMGDRSSRWLSPFEEMSHFFERLSHSNWAWPWHKEWTAKGELHPPFSGKLPHMDIIERDGELLMRAELPGVDKKDLEVSMTNHAITIKASTHYEDKEEKGEYYRSEISHGSFCRTMLLPSDVDLENIKTSFKNGLLEIHVPKLAKESRKITIN